MTEKPVSITAAFSDAWDRMLTILFRPFRLDKWLVLGFTAWLAQLGRGGKGGFNWNFGNWSDSGKSEFVSSGGGGIDWPDFNAGGQWVLDHPGWAALGAFGCLFLIALVLVLFWVSSRGKFMFLDNVVHDRAEVVQPWKRFRRLGNSLFGFQLAFVASTILVILLAVAVGIGIATSVDGGLDGPAGWFGMLVGLSFAIFFVFVIAFTQYFLDAFVVPLMHRYDLGVMEAWSRFGDIFRRHPWVLLFSGLFVLIVGFAAVMAAVIAGVLTCCIGLLLIILPYVGTVVLLPIPVTYRAFTVALLDQIDPGYFPESESVVVNGAGVA
jgi:hypothetical protein